MPRQDGRQGRDDRIADTLRTGVPTGLDELARLGRTTSRSPTQAARTAPLKRLTDASNTSAGSPSATATWPTTASDHSLKQAASVPLPTHLC